MISSATEDAYFSSKVLRLDVPGPHARGHNDHQINYSISETYLSRRPDEGGCCSPGFPGGNVGFSSRSVATLPSCLMMKRFLGSGNTSVGLDADHTPDSESKNTGDQNLISCFDRATAGLCFTGL